MNARTFRNAAFGLMAAAALVVFVWMPVPVHADEWCTAGVSFSCGSCSGHPNCDIECINECGPGSVSVTNSCTPAGGGNCDPQCQVDTTCYRYGCQCTIPM